MSAGASSACLKCRHAIQQTDIRPYHAPCSCVNCPLWCTPTGSTCMVVPHAWQTQSLSLSSSCTFVRSQQYPSSPISLFTDIPLRQRKDPPPPTPTNTQASVSSAETFPVRQQPLQCSLALALKSLFLILKLLSRASSSSIACLHTYQQAGIRPYHTSLWCANRSIFCTPT
jgi:hypothetical protein